MNCTEKRYKCDISIKTEPDDWSDIDTADREKPQYASSESAAAESMEKRYKCNEGYNSISEAESTIGEQWIKMENEYRIEGVSIKIEPELLINDTEDRENLMQCSSTTAGNSLECHLCHKSFKNLQTFKNHKLIHIDQKTFKCDICDRLFTQHQYLRTHTKRRHPESYISSRKISKNVQLLTSFKCDVCDKYFKGATALRVHNNTHQKPFKCHLCSKSFTIEMHLQGHIVRSHFENELFKCNLCDSTFTEARLLYRHFRSHNVTTKKFKCDICEKLFSQRAYLKVHKSVHTRPFKCNICQKSFSHRSSLKDHHSIIHSDEKTFKCDSCGKLFPTKHYIKLHYTRLKCSTNRTET